jgi:hypothetical protein
MDLEAAFQKHRPKNHLCPVLVILESLDDKNRKVLETALNGQLAPWVIAKTLRVEGLKISENSIYAHKKGECKCATK